MLHVCVDLMSKQYDSKNAPTVIVQTNNTKSGKFQTCNSGIKQF